METKLAEQQALEAFAESLQGARAPLVKVSSDRGAAPTHKAIRFHCRPFVELRSSLLLRHQVTQANCLLASSFGKVSEEKAVDQLRRGAL